jgi:DNA-binding winged helix-turn-helix (wHTH) protein
MRVETPVIVDRPGPEEIRGPVGADDYVTCSIAGVAGAVDAVRRRLRPGNGGRERGRSTEPIAFGDIRIEPATRTVLRAGVPVPLRPKEFDLLLALARREGEVVSRFELLREVWGYGSEVMSRTVDTHVGQLRAKLEAAPAEPRWILTVRKSGTGFDQRRRPLSLSVADRVDARRPARPRAPPPPAGGRLRRRESPPPDPPVAGAPAGTNR